MGLRIWIVATSVMLFSVNVLSQEYETTTTQPLLAGEKVEWKDLKLQVVKVEENSVSTDLDNSAGESGPGLIIYLLGAEIETLCFHFIERESIQIIKRPHTLCGVYRRKRQQYYHKCGGQY